MSNSELESILSQCSWLTYRACAYYPEWGNRTHGIYFVYYVREQKWEVMGAPKGRYFNTDEAYQMFLVLDKEVT